MIMVAMAALALALVPLWGGSWKRLAQVRFRSVWVLFIAVAVQISILTSFEATTANARTWFAAIHLSSYALAAGFVFINRRIPGLWLVGLGGLCNGITIALNQGTLPASPAALQRAGLHLNPEEFSNSAHLENPMLPLLGDIFAIPAGWPLANVFSIGDVLIWVGIFVSVHGICVPSSRKHRLRRLARRSRGHSNVTANLPPMTGQQVLPQQESLAQPRKTTQPAAAPEH